ncbi:MAG: PEP-CTERM sorting domain-containing protein [Rhodocyclaceae bacterium]|nr:PEP-CTERM sorting domain-containing protein [Rhodocyclaceae bacterium]
MQSILVRSVAALAVAGSLAGAAQAASVPVTFERLSGLSGFSGTSVFRADLSGLGLTDIASITLFDSNSKQGGSPGAFSGFDLDAIMLSTTRATAASQMSGLVTLPAFDFTTAGTAFTAGTQRAPVAPKLSGTDATGLNVDPAAATLGQFDAVSFTSGSVSLGDGGSITFHLNAPVSTAGLYLYVGEVGNTPGENLGGVFVASAPVPEPSTWALTLAGLGLCSVFLRRRRQA